MPQKLIRVELNALGSIHKIYEAQLLTYLRLMDKRVGLLINCNAEKIKAGKNDQQCKRTQREGMVKASYLLIVSSFSVFSVVFF